MSYDIFFVRRDPGQTFEDALDDLEGSFEGGDPGPLSEADVEAWEAVLGRAREILGTGVEVNDDGAETRELTDPATGIGLTLIEGEFELHVSPVATGDDELAVMATAYDLARAIENATGLEGYDPQLGEPVSASSDTSPTRRRWADDPEPADDDDERGGRGGRAGSGRGLPPPSLRRSMDLERDPFDPEAAEVAGARRPRRWWEFWRAPSVGR